MYPIFVLPVLTKIPHGGSVFLYIHAFFVFHLSVVCSVVVWALLPVLRVLGSNLVLELPCLLQTVSCVILHHTRSSVVAYIFSLIPLVIAKIITLKSFLWKKKQKKINEKKIFCTSRRLLLISHRGSHPISHRWSELYYYCDDCKISHPDSNVAMTPRWLKGYVGREARFLKI